MCNCGSAPTRRTITPDAKIKAKKALRAAMEKHKKQAAKKK